MMRRLVIALALALSVALPARAAHEAVYEGSVGPASIVIGLSTDPGDVTGRYFYRSQRIDIDVSGAWKGAALALTSDLTGDKLALTRSGQGLVGTLTTAKGRTLPVKLRPAAAAAANPDLPSELTAYQRLQLQDLKLSPQKAETRDGKTIRWYGEGLSGISLFRVEGGYAPAAMAAMNRTLARHQWGEISGWFQCPGYDGKGSGVESSAAEKPWLGADYVSYVWTTSYSCAHAAHPDFGSEGHSFDARDGHELKLDEVLPVGAKPPPREDSDPWYDYRSKVFAPAVVALMTRYHKAEMTPPKGDDDCDYTTDTDVWAFPAWALTQKGLWLGAVFPRVARSCDSPEWAVLPWSALPTRR